MLSGCSDGDGRLTVATLSRAPALSAGVLTADLTRLGAELEHLPGQGGLGARGRDGRGLDLLIRELLSSPEEVPDGKR